MTPAARLLARALRDDRGSGSVLAVAIVATVMMMTGLLLTLAAALTVKHSVQNGADAAALAAADVAAGFVGGYPCDAAARVAERNGDELVDCEVTGSDATVRLRRTIAGIEMTVSARAGPGPQQLQARPGVSAREIASGVPPGSVSCGAARRTLLEHGLHEAVLHCARPAVGFAAFAVLDAAAPDIEVVLRR